MAIALLLGTGAAFAGLFSPDSETEPSPTTPRDRSSSAGVTVTPGGLTYSGNLDHLNKAQTTPSAEVPARASGRNAVRSTAGRANPSTRQLERAAGQKLVGRYVGLQPSSEFLRRIRAGRLGGVIIFGDNVGGGMENVAAAVGRMQEVAASGGNPPLLVAIDQEGGSVKRLRGLPPHRSPRAMGVAGAAAAEQEGRAAGRALARIGVNVNLAPVVDVPSGSSSFLGDRAYGGAPSVVSSVACSFADGLRNSQVRPTLKHFPGLGAASANTDSSATTVTASLSQLRAGWSPYRRCAMGGLVMLSNAAYTNLTGDTPAVLSADAYRALRSQGFRGLTISDDLQANAVDPIDGLAVGSTRAGLDLALYARTEAGAARAFQQLVDTARRDPEFASLIVADAQRIRESKTGR